MTRMILAAIVALALAGCATRPAVVDERFTEVKVPVAVQPVRPEQVPEPPAPLPKRPDSLPAAADVLLAKWCEAVAYLLRADPLLRISAGQAPTAAQIYPECERPAK
ncbi:MAG TPA: hypothetical protein VM326_02325 [Sphingomicrobium sp.]|nr:hypothetical protein [Sphingomicrobium sp.]